MREDFLHFVWQYKYFQQSDIYTTQGESITIKFPGYHNHNAGPDFLDAVIVINAIEWHGHVEIHHKASEWYQHHHENDLKYDNVILHVVYENDVDVFHQDKTTIPSLVLNGILKTNILINYEHLLHTNHSISCKENIDDVPRIKRMQMLDRVLVDRIERKAQFILSLLDEKERDWEETTYSFFAQYLGMKVNNTPLKQLSDIIPAKLLRLNAHLPITNEALLFGAAGFLQSTSNDLYEQKLYKEFRFLQHKYNLGDKEMKQHQWNFLRLRPANFPSIRIAQLSRIMTEIPHLCSAFLHVQNKVSFYRLMDIPTSSYWNSHYRFGVESKSKHEKHIGKKTLDSILINVIVPLQFAYGIDKGNDQYKEKAIDLLESITAEHNKITKVFKQLGLNIRSALDSQAFIELYNNYCADKKCMECGIGHHVLNQKTTLKVKEIEKHS
ncbi:DUF2851 family protein [Flammeovirga yaeyamensis]|uniref:DUF2851 family protein n=1 Tax=Flammeovirga yaeyamensis TaxID=367791 RepID=A0AAX1N4L8_9BACT|nr:DUF2851 family protein [Flammeovirga yaeyamensis]MBB3701421.1 hypothetical protein [Flammeovirga yaeyamensis]NMF38547.1 DUF2851 family protein [Flammeovirga yaeyamensis]QWG02374.1 DUF2851 family protein [Flammeovirga yaeyamensis]